MGIFDALYRKNNVPVSSARRKNIPAYVPSQASSYPSERDSDTIYSRTRNWKTACSSSDGSALDVYDCSGNRIQLGSRETKASGGEGTVYSLPGNSRILIKIYKPETLNNAEKMKAIRQRILDMIQVKGCADMKFLAWPLMPVFNVRKQVIGFAMRKCSGDSFLALRGPANIQRRFPGWDRLTLTRAALDYVQKLKQITAKGVLVNDFNPANFLVDPQGNVSFIDCDSFQIPSSSGNVNISRTFFPSHTAPELLKNKSLLEKPRNIHHVEFGAALTVFNILMCGLHPYNYFDPNHKSACGSPDENLIKGRCPLGKGTGCMLPRGGWYNLWSYLTGSLKGTFITTFRDGHSDPSKRTTLDGLESELKKMIFVMGQDPQRKNMTPQTPKPRGDKSSSSNDF